MLKKIALKTSNDKGMALVATLVMVLTISAIAIAMLSMTSNDIKLSSLQEASKETFYIAEAGLERAIAYLEELGNPAFTAPKNPFEDENGGSPILGDGRYQVEITWEPPLSYYVTSKGIMPWNNTTGQINTTIESKVILDNFAMFAYFSDIEIFPSDIDAGYGGKEIWFQSGDRIEGKLHSNDRLNMAGTPTFYGAVTSSYKNPATGDTSWKAYDKSTKPNFLGTPPYQGGVDRIELPTFRNITEPSDSRSLQRIAAGSKEFIDSHSGSHQKGVYLPNNGNSVTNGIWIKGDVKQINFGTELGNSKIFIDQSNITNKETTIYTITEGNTINLGGTFYNSGTVVEERNTNTNVRTYTHYNDKTNGVIFVDGEVKSLQGNATDGGVKGTYTLASNYDINITGNILYNTRVNNPDCFDVEDGYPDIPDTLGLVTEKNIKIPKKDIFNNIVPNNIEINAIMMALGTSFYFQGFKDDIKDTLTVYGSFIQKQRGPVGTFSSNKRTGYNKDYHFDTRMNVNNPKFGEVLPPYFPTTGKYVKLWWKEVD